MGYNVAWREADPSFLWLRPRDETTSFLIFTLSRADFPQFFLVKAVFVHLFLKSRFPYMKVTRGKWAHTVYISLEITSDHHNPLKTDCRQPLEQKEYSEEIVQDWLSLFITFQFSSHWSRRRNVLPLHYCMKVTPLWSKDGYVAFTFRTNFVSQTQTWSGF